MEFVEDKDVYAVNLFYQMPDGKILGVSRRDDHTSFGLPGGKVDKNETPIQALIREVKEETGVTIEEQYCVPFYEREDETHGFISRTYTYVQNPTPIEFTEGVHEENGGYAKMIKWEDLIIGAFGIYNYRLGQYANRFLKCYWFITYKAPYYGSFRNAIIDVHPLTWLTCHTMTTTVPDDFVLISFQEVDLTDYQTYGKLYK